MRSATTAPRLLDASTAHRVAHGWVYGFAELAPGQAEAIAAANAASPIPAATRPARSRSLRPLVDAGLVPPDFPLTINAVSGYSGGGRRMIEAYEKGEAPAFELYALGLEHKHVPEIVAHSKLTARPLFVPSVGNFRQGMLVADSARARRLARPPEGGGVRSRLCAPLRRVRRMCARRPTPANGRLDAVALNDGDELEVFVFANEARRHAVLVARLDNLGKGASGAAVQNLRSDARAIARLAAVRFAAGGSAAVRFAAAVRPRFARRGVGRSCPAAGSSEPTFEICPGSSE